MASQHRFVDGCFITNVTLCLPVDLSPSYSHIFERALSLYSLVFTRDLFTLAIFSLFPEIRESEVEGKKQVKEAGGINVER